MSYEQVEKWFDLYGDDSEDDCCRSPQFENIEDKLSLFDDVHAMMVMSSVANKGREGQSLISNYHNDQIFFMLCEEEIARLKEQDVIALCACGVFLDEEALSMFI